MNCENIDRNIAPFYMAVMLEIERRRLQLNISMQEVCDRSGLADYYFSKALHASTPSGRQANCRALQDIVDALFPEVYDVVIKPKTGMRLNPEQLRCKIKFAAAAANPKLPRELMSELGKKGAKARLENYRDMTPEQRAAVAEKARKTRRETISRRAQASKPHTNKRAERLAAKEERRKTRQENRRLLKPSSALEPCVGMHAASASCCIVDGICRSAE